MIKELLQPLEQGYALITPTGRMSRYLQYWYAVKQIESGKSSWETPDILPWYAWLQQIWEDFVIRHDIDQILLGPEQQRWVWQEIIRKSVHAKQLLQPAHSARNAIVAWSLCQQWQIKVFPDDLYINQDAYAFQQWVYAYQRLCESRGWIDDGGIADVLASASQLRIKPAKIALTGFDEFTPMQRMLLDKLQSSGSEIKQLPLIKRSREITAYGYKDSREEIYAAAIWARKLLESNATASIGIVVHNLRAQRNLIENTFNDVLLPGNILVNSENFQKPFNISQGVSLQHYPVIDAALLILSFGNLSLSMEEFGSLLRSPFILDAGKEDQQRAKLDVCLRKYGESWISINTIYRLINNKLINPDDLPKSFILSCEKFGKVFQTGNKKQVASEWAKLFTELLKTFSWPGERPLDSAEYQAVTEWQTLLGKFAALDQVTTQMTFTDALSQLRNQVINTTFQPETPEVPIQISGLSGAAGMQFDHLRVICLHEEVWPPKSEPNPFIPIKLQRDLNMPDASANNKLAWAREMTQRLIDSSPHVVMTYPRNEKDRSLRTSPLIQHYLQSEDKQFFTRVPGYAEKIFTSHQTELIEDSIAPAIPAGETTSGGAGLFKDQAACPFRAFARYRLNAIALESKDIGLDAMDRGLIVHDVMEKLWKSLGSYQKLLEMQDTSLDRLINNVISKTVGEYQKHFPLTFTDRFIAIERARLFSLVKDWMVEERKRQPFTVKESEQWHLFKFNDIEIRTRIDRIDQLADGRYVIIDYKTGDPSVKAWFDDRPDEPQLPLYAITTDGDIAAIVFAKIKRGEVAYIGLAKDEALIPGVKTVDKINSSSELVSDWDALFKNWQIVLKKLAIGFRNGEAFVDPKDNMTCRYCDLHTFCRIYEKGAGMADQGQENTDE